MEDEEVDEVAQLDLDVTERSDLAGDMSNFLMTGTNRRLRLHIELVCPIAACNFLAFGCPLRLRKTLPNSSSTDHLIPKI